VQILQLTESMLTPFVGGQLEIMDHKNFCAYCGEIESVRIIRDFLVVKFAWCASNDDNGNQQGLGTNWTSINKLTYSWMLPEGIISKEYGGRITVGFGMRLVELLIFLPKECGPSYEEYRLNRSQVKGLDAVP